MKTKKYNKLVRDKIPEIIKNDSKDITTKIVNGDEKIEYLFKKLLEEAEELKESRSIEELADIQEVINSITKELKFTTKDLERVRRQKASTRGSFEKGIVLLETIEKD